MPKYLPVFILFFVIMLLLPMPARGEISTGVAYAIPVKGSNITQGALISSEKNGYRLTTQPYDPLIFGITTKSPAISIQTQNIPKGSYLILSSGKAYAQVSTENGAIKNGDLLTSSNQPGVAMKASVNGFVLGIALESYQSKDPKKIGLILINVTPHYNGSFTAIKSNIIATLKDIANNPFTTTNDMLRYFFAGLITIATFTLGILNFGKVTSNGVEALGRNPFAAKMIQLGIIFNIGILLAIMVGGLGLAYLILSL